MTHRFQENDALWIGSGDHTDLLYWNNINNEFWQFTTRVWDQANIHMCQKPHILRSKKITKACNPKWSSNSVREYLVLHSMLRNWCHCSQKVFSLYNLIKVLAILYPKSLANLVVKVRTRHSHQILFCMVRLNTPLKNKARFGYNERPQMGIGAPVIKIRRLIFIMGISIFIKRYTYAETSLVLWLLKSHDSPPHHTTGEASFLRRFIQNL